MLAKTLFPLLSRAVGFYMHMSETREGVVHLRSSFDPEIVRGNDTTFDLALFRWGLQTAIQLSVDVPLVDPLLVSKWQETLSALTPFPTDAFGWMLNSGFSAGRLNSSAGASCDDHTYQGCFDAIWGHLFPFFPLQLQLPASDPVALHSFNVFARAAADFKGSGPSTPPPLSDSDSPQISSTCSSLSGKRALDGARLTPIFCFTLLQASVVRR